MKSLVPSFALLAVLLFTALAPAAEPARAEPAPADDLEILVAPIALYPDALIALILPASTRPAEIVLAARFLDRGGNAEAAQREPWDESVRALTRSREVIEYLDRHLDWTRRLGDAFADRPDDVMDAIQSARARARANGLLPDTPQQTVLVEAEEIRIVPASPTVIYVPRYDPEIIYVSRPPDFYPSAWLTFGIGYGVGAWLNYDCDWRYRSVRIMHRPPAWYHHPDWHRRPAAPAGWTRWTPRPRRDHDRDRAGPEHPHRLPRDRHRDSAAPADSTAFNHPPAHAPRFDDAHRTRPFGGAPDFDRHDRHRAPRNDRHPSPSSDATPLSAPAIVATPPPGPTAAAIVSTPPPGPTAPAIVSTPPGATFQPSPSTRPPARAPRHRDGEHDTRSHPPRRESHHDDASADRSAPRAGTDSHADHSARSDRHPHHEREH